MVEKMICGEAEKFSKHEKQAFIKLVATGGEVNEHTLCQNVQSAKCLVFLRIDDELSGVAALKVPNCSYRKKFSCRTGVTVDKAAFPYELGYVFVVESARGKGHSGNLVRKAVEAAGSGGVFATSRDDNERMHRTLENYGFGNAGKAYPGENTGKLIQLFLRPAQTTSKRSEM